LRAEAKARSDLERDASETFYGRLKRDFTRRLSEPWVLDSLTGDSGVVNFKSWLAAFGMQSDSDAEVRLVVAA
jgi:hypothetical protein